MKDLADKIKKQILKNTTDPKDLYFCDKYFRLMKDYVKINISYDDICEFKEVKKQFYRGAKNILEKLIEKKSLDQELKKLEEIEFFAKRFYKLADKRSEVMVKNMLKHKGSPISVMIIGGYHTKKITQILRNKGISYEVIKPDISTNYNKDLYFKKMEKQAAWFFKYKNDIKKPNGNLQVSFIEIYSRIKMITNENIAKEIVMSFRNKDVFSKGVKTKAWKFLFEPITKLIFKEEEITEVLKIISKVLKKKLLLKYYKKYVKDEKFLNAIKNLQQKIVELNKDPSKDPNELNVFIKKLYSIVWKNYSKNLTQLSKNLNIIHLTRIKEDIRKYIEHYNTISLDENSLYIRVKYKDTIFEYAFNGEKFRQLDDKEKKFLDALNDLEQKIAELNNDPSKNLNVLKLFITKLHHSVLRYFRNKSNRLSKVMKNLDRIYNREKLKKLKITTKRVKTNPETLLVQIIYTDFYKNSCKDTIFNYSYYNKHITPTLDPKSAIELHLAQIAQLANKLLANLQKIPSTNNIIRIQNIGEIIKNYNINIIQCSTGPKNVLEVIDRSYELITKKLEQLKYNCNLSDNILEIKISFKNHEWTTSYNLTNSTLPSIYKEKRILRKLNFITNQNTNYIMKNLNTNEGKVFMIRSLRLFMPSLSHIELLSKDGKNINPKYYANISKIFKISLEKFKKNKEKNDSIFKNLLYLEFYKYIKSNFNKDRKIKLIFIKDFLKTFIPEAYHEYIDTICPENNKKIQDEIINLFFENEKGIFEKGLKLKKISNKTLLYLIKIKIFKLLDAKKLATTSWFWDIYEANTNVPRLQNILILNYIKDNKLSNHEQIIKKNIEKYFSLGIIFYVLNFKIKNIFQTLNKKIEYPDRINYITNFLKILFPKDAKNFTRKKIEKHLTKSITALLNPLYNDPKRISKVMKREKDKIFQASINISDIYSSGIKFITDLYLEQNLFFHKIFLSINSLKTNLYPQAKTKESKNYSVATQRETVEYRKVNGIILFSISRLLEHSIFEIYEKYFTQGFDLKSNIIVLDLNNCSIVNYQALADLIALFGCNEKIIFEVNKQDYSSNTLPIFKDKYIILYLLKTISNKGRLAIRLLKHYFPDRAIILGDTKNLKKNNLGINKKNSNRDEQFGHIYKEGDRIIVGNKDVFKLRIKHDIYWNPNIQNLNLNRSVEIFKKQRAKEKELQRKKEKERRKKLKEIQQKKEEKRKRKEEEKRRKKLEQERKRKEKEEKRKKLEQERKRKEEEKKRKEEEKKREEMRKAIEEYVKKKSDLLKQNIQIITKVERTKNGEKQSPVKKSDVKYLEKEKQKSQKLIRVVFNNIKKVIGYTSDMFSKQILITSVGLSQSEYVNFESILDDIKRIAMKEVCVIKNILVHAIGNICCWDIEQFKIIICDTDLYLLKIIKEIVENNNMKLYWDLIKTIIDYSLCIKTNTLTAKKYFQTLDYLCTFNNILPYIAINDSIPLLKEMIDDINKNIKKIIKKKFNIKTYYEKSNFYKINEIANKTYKIKLGDNDNVFNIIEKYIFRGDFNKQNLKLVFYGRKISQSEGRFLKRLGLNFERQYSRLEHDMIIRTTLKNGHCYEQYFNFYNNDYVFQDAKLKNSSNIDIKTWKLIYEFYKNQNITNKFVEILTEIENKIGYAKSIGCSKLWEAYFVLYIDKINPNDLVKILRRFIKTQKLKLTINNKNKELIRDIYKFRTFRCAV
ncbi:hypothetical protein ACFL5N_02215 [bacterium]